MPMPAVIRPRITIHLRTPSVADHINGNSPFFGDSDTASG